MSEILWQTKVLLSLLCLHLLVLTRFVNVGVRLHSGYGATELGYVVAPYSPLNQDLHDWAYIRISERVHVLFEPQHDAENSHELVFLVCLSICVRLGKNRVLICLFILYQEGDIHEPFVINSSIEGERGYRTKDLVVRHPTKPDLWKM